MVLGVDTLLYICALVTTNSIQSVSEYNRIVSEKWSQMLLFRRSAKFIHLVPTPYFVISYHMSLYKLQNLADNVLYIEVK